MINILANSMRIATRTDGGPGPVIAGPAAKATGTRRWLPPGHWWLDRDRAEGRNRR
ncbi:hypothetical protein LCL97_12965 [Seohaeicola saemankumensis]|nr:hypothetical protein [Seohaeicola saemankumensis]MCA0871741.1 hypothetical protein [Seohaeicola saemankumensis]